MVTEAYVKWDAAGRPYQLATPILEMKNLARTRYGIGFLGDIGNEDHLQADFPQDHTPYSYTAWPDPLPGYVVCALDLKHEKGFAEALLADAKAGRAPWIKYLNFGFNNYSIKREWEPVPNDDEHLHISVRTDWISRSIGSYDPLGGMMDEGAAILALLLDGKSPTGVQTVDGGKPRVYIDRRIYDLGIRLTNVELQLNKITSLLETLATTPMPGVPASGKLTITMTGTAEPTTEVTAP